MTKRAACYIRLSRYRGAEDPTTSPERQREATAAYAKAQGWEVVAVLEDLDVSGGDAGLRLSRPGLEQIRRLWGQIDVLIVPKIDRLARNVLDFHQFAQEAKQNGCDLVSVNEALDLSTPTGKFVATILAAFAEMELETIKQRTREGLRGAALQGRWTGGPAPYGYRSAPHPAGKGMTLEVVDDEATAIRAAVDRVLTGAPLNRVAAWMNEHAPKPRRTDQWNRTSLYWVLTGESVLGRLTVGGKILRGEDGYPLQAFPPILTQSEAQNVRLALKPKQAARRASHGARMLSGILLCSGCARPLTPTKRPHDVDLYRCYTKGHGGGCEAPVACSAPAVEQYVEDDFLAREGDHELYQLVSTDTDPGPGLAAVDEAIAATLAELATAATPEAFSRLQALQSDREDILSRPRTGTVERVPTGETIADSWADMSPADRRDVIGRYYQPLILQPGRRGRRGFDPARLDLVPRDTEDAV